MDIKSVLKSNSGLIEFYCEELDVYLRLNELDGVKSIYVSDTLDNIYDSDCPLLENVLTLEAILDMSVEPVETLTLSDVLNADNHEKIYSSSKLNSKFMCRMIKIGVNYVPRLYLMNPFTNKVSDGEITDAFELVDIVNAKFMEVN